MIKSSIPFLLAIMLITVGCAESIESRRINIKSQHPQWDQNTVENVTERRIVPGMTEEMVSVAMEKPWDISQKGKFTIWAYGYFRGCGETTCQELTYFIYFEDQKVVKTEGDKKKLGLKYQ